MKLCFNLAGLQQGCLDPNALPFPSKLDLVPSNLTTYKIKYRATSMFHIIGDIVTLPVELTLAEIVITCTLSCLHGHPPLLKR